MARGREAQYHGGMDYDCPSFFDVIDQDGERQIGEVLSLVDENDEGVFDPSDAVACIGVVTLGSRAGYMIRIPIDQDWEKHTLH